METEKEKAAKTPLFATSILPGMYTVESFGIRMEVSPSQVPTVTTLKKKYDKLGEYPLSIWTGG